MISVSVFCIFQCIVVSWVAFMVMCFFCVNSETALLHNNTLDVLLWKRFVMRSSLQGRLLESLTA